MVVLPKEFVARVAKAGGTVTLVEFSGATK